MKRRNPIDRYDLKIHKKDYVLEVGSGHNPHFRSNVIVEKFIESNFHRSSDIKIFQHQIFFNADGAKLPFKDKEFDYLICCHVLEHVEDPEIFVKELQRVSKRGYIEVPSLIGETLFPKKSHKWFCLEIDKKLVLYDKNNLPLIFPNFGKTFLNFLPYQSLALRIFYLSNHQADTVRYEWDDNIEIIVNPADTYYRSFFAQPWSDQMSKVIFPNRNKMEDIKISLRVFLHLVLNMIRNRFRFQKLLTLDEYLKKTV